MKKSERTNRAVGLLIIGFLIGGLYGCGLTQSIVEANSDILRPTATEESVEIPCVRSSFQVTTTPALEFHWSSDGGLLVFSDKPNSWTAFDPTTKTYDLPNVPVETQVAENTDTYQSVLDTLMDINEDPISMISFSPDMQSALIFIDENHSATPPPTSDYERGPSTTSMFTVLYWRAGNDNIVTIGTLPGSVAEVVWSDLNSGALIAIHKWFWTPEIHSFFWVFSAETAGLTAIWAENNPDKAPEIWAYSPDNSKALVGFAESPYLEIYEFETGLSFETTIPKATSVWWLNALESVLVLEGISHRSTISFYLALYDIEAGTHTSLLAESIQISPFLSNSFQLSPNEEWFAYIESDSKNLYILDLCLD